jgi:hypothetical protein
MRSSLLITTALCSISASAFADETMKFRSIYHLQAGQREVLRTSGFGETQLFEIGDQPRPGRLPSQLSPCLLA